MLSVLITEDAKESSGEANEMANPPITDFFINSRRFILSIDKYY